MDNLYAKQVYWLLLGSDVMSWSKVMFSSQISSSPSSAGLELLAEKSVTVTSAGNNSESRLIVKNNMEIIADTFTVTDTLGEEILAVDESNVR